MKQHKCQKCGRFAKGHPKPLGDDCTMPQMSENEIEAQKIVELQETENGVAAFTLDLQRGLDRLFGITTQKVASGRETVVTLYTNRKEKEAH